METKYKYGALHCTPATSNEIAKILNKDKCKSCYTKNSCSRCQLIIQWLKDGKPTIELTMFHPIEMEKFSN